MILLSHRRQRQQQKLGQQIDAYLRLRPRWHADPCLYAIHRFGITPTWQQHRILANLIPDGAKVSVRSGHGIGKSTSAAIALLWFLETRDYAKIPCTAPTSHQLRDILWSEVARCLRRADQVSAQRGDIPRLWLSTLFRLTQDRIYDVAAPNEWCAVARTARKENPEALQGFHAGDVTISDDGRQSVQEGDGKLLFILDEASGIPDAVYEAAEGALNSLGARVLMLGNPTRNTGFFAASHKDVRGDYTALHFRSQDSPLGDPDYRARLVRKWGEGSNIVRVRADGDFPKQDDDVLIALEWTELALARAPTRTLMLPRRLGVDVARYGDDRTALVLRQGNELLHLRIYAKQDTMQTVGVVMQAIREWQVDEVYVDVIGVGAGVFDRLKELDPSGVILTAVNVAESSPERHADSDAQGKTLRDYLWLELAQWFRDEEPCLAGGDALAEDLAGELASVKSRLDSSGRIVVESKDEMKKRLGRSPDLSDALGCTFAPRFEVASSTETVARGYYGSTRQRSI
jgi:phage terminase large subunit